MTITPTCPKCNQMLPTKTIVDVRLAGTLRYPVIDISKLQLEKGRYEHKRCPKAKEWDGKINF